MTVSARRVREAIGEVRASYNVAFAASMLIGAALLILLFATWRQGAAFWALFALAVASLAPAIAIIVYAVVRKPELLRSERATTFARTVETLGNDRISDSDKALIARSLEPILRLPRQSIPPVPHRQEWTMSEQTFLVAFDTMDPLLDPRAIKDHFDRSAAFTHWWNHLPGVFMVTATIGEDAIARQLREIAGGVRFLVIAARPEQSEGLLDEKGWTWIRERERELRHDVDAKHA